MTRYGFRAALSAFFHADASGAQARLPPGLRVLESHPGLGVVAVTVFDFDASEVGAYRELVVSVLVPPFAPRDAAMPDAAFFPILVATTTPASRVHAAARWRLPELDRCVDVRVADVGELRRQATVLDRGVPVLKLEVETEARGRREPSRRLYQCYGRDAEAVHRVEISIVGPLSEHEDERGELELGDGPLAASFADLIEDAVPFREQCMDAGEQRFEDLVVHSRHDDQVWSPA